MGMFFETNDSYGLNRFVVGGGVMIMYQEPQPEFYSNIYYNMFEDPVIGNHSRQDITYMYFGTQVFEYNGTQFYLTLDGVNIQHTHHTVYNDPMKILSPNGPYTINDGITVNSYGLGGGILIRDGDFYLKGSLTNRSYGITFGFSLPLVF